MRWTLCALCHRGGLDRARSSACVFLEQFRSPPLGMPLYTRQLLHVDVVSFISFPPSFLFFFVIKLIREQNFVVKDNNSWCRYRFPLVPSPCVQPQFFCRREPVGIFFQIIYICYICWCLDKDIKMHFFVVYKLVLCHIYCYASFVFSLDDFLSNCRDAT